MERIYLFLPSIIIIAMIGVAAGFVARNNLRRFGENLQDIEWLQENEMKLNLRYGVPMINICAPTLEELIFRAPIIFSSVTPEASYAILATSFLFGLVHFRGFKISLFEFSSFRKKDTTHKDFEKELKDYQQSNRKMILFRKVLHVVLTTILGVLAGYYGILYQSIWVSVGVHALWNLLIPLVVPLFIYFCVLMYLYLMRVLSNFRFKITKLRVSKYF